MTPADHSGLPQDPEKFTRVLARVLRPLIRLLLHYQITYPQLISLLKAIYVEVAETEMQVGDRRQSDSRINLLTGVHRKDVKRLRAAPQADALMPSAVSIGAQLIAQWQGNSDYVDAAGQPKPLPLRSTESSAVSFEQLVAQVVKQDIRPRVILDEWLRLGIAHMEDDKLVLNTGAFTPDAGFDEKAFYFAKNLHDHMSASASNLMGFKPSYFDRSVYYDKLTAESVSELGALADKLGMTALTSMNKAALDKQKADADNSDATFRMNFGVFNYNNVMRDSEDDNHSG